MYLIILLLKIFCIMSNIIIINETLILLNLLNILLHFSFTHDPIILIYIYIYMNYHCLSLFYLSI